jgi:hypothetical protein
MVASIVYLDRSAFRSADVDALRSAVHRLVEFVRQREPQLVYYGFEIDAPARAMTVVAVHPDSASLELHLGIGGPEFAKVGAFIELRSIDVYGVPSDAALAQLREKGKLLGRDVTVTVHDLASGFTRLANA